MFSVATTAIVRHLGRLVIVLMLATCANDVTVPPPDLLRRDKGLVLVGTLLISVTAPDGAKLHINPNFITKLYPTREAQDKGPNQMVVTGARCVITMADGKFVSVKEPCDYILNLIEGKPTRGR